MSNDYLTNMHYTSFANQLTDFAAARTFIRLDSKSIDPDTHFIIIIFLILVYLGADMR